MAYQEYVQKAIATRKSYTELPAKVKAAVSLPEWKTRVRELCIQQGAAWDISQARSVCSEPEYYEALVATYKAWCRLYPYHLAEYIARVLRVTPFRYYSDMLFLCLKEEAPYDRIPNFTAADVVRVTGVGRNQYIALLNACRSKRLLWRLNKGLARELLPAAPPDIRLEPWWRVAVVNVGESEFRDLTADESSLLRAAADGDRQLPVSAFDPQLLQQLYKKGLLYLTIPVRPEDRFSIPPLEGFVSNKTSEAGDESVDPFEPLMYRLFLANSDRLTQARLADILSTDLQQLLLATSLAVRLGFATRLNPGSTDDMTASSTPPSRGSSRVFQTPSGGLGSSSGPIPDSLLDAAAGTPEGLVAEGTEGLWGDEGAAGVDNGAAGAGEGGGGGAVAVVVDAETTSFLMMGALSAGLKRHSVSLFEGGRVSGAAVMDELIAELQASAAAGAVFEGEDMAQLMRVIQSLGVLLEAVKAAVRPQGHSLELLRQESFAGLDPLSAAKVLSATYTSIIPIAPLPGHTLSHLLGPQLQQAALAGRAAAAHHASNSSSTRADNGGVQQQQQQQSRGASPTFFGPPSPEADSPWLQLALYAAARSGPVSVVFGAGCRVWRLPPQLQGCTHALMWGWGPAAAAASGAVAADTRPLLIEGSSLLSTLNELLSRTAVMVQPLVHADQLPPAAAAAAGQGEQPHLVKFVDVPLPLCPKQQQEGLSQAMHSTSSSSSVPVQSSDISNAADGATHGGRGTGLTSSSGTAVEGQHQQEQQQQQVQWDPFGFLGQDRATEQPGSAALQQQQQQLVVLAVDRTGSTAGQQRLLQLPGQVVCALQELQLVKAVGWLRLVRLPPAAGTPAVAGPSKQPWVPLSVNLGAPLFCPTLCQLVCANMAEQHTLTDSGEAAWRAAQLVLQRRLEQHVGLANGSNRSPGDDGPVQQARSTAAAGWGRTDFASGMAGGGVQLPPHSLLFDGHSLLPVDLSGCLQGVQLW